MMLLFESMVASFAWPRMGAKRTGVPCGAAVPPAPPAAGNPEALPAALESTQESRLLDCASTPPAVAWPFTSDRRREVLRCDLNFCSRLTVTRSNTHARERVCC